MSPHLQDELILLFFQLRPFPGHYDPQELILQTLHGDHEVQQGHLDGGFRQVVRVPQLRRDVEAEVLGVLDGAVSQLDADAASLLEGLLQEQRLQDGVQFLSNVLQEDRGAELDAVLQRAHKVRVCEFDDVEVFGLLHVLDPLVGLSLRVDHQWPAASVAACEMIGVLRRGGGREGRWKGGEGE